MGRRHLKSPQYPWEIGGFLRYGRVFSIRINDPWRLCFERPKGSRGPADGKCDSDPGDVRHGLLREGRCRGGSVVTADRGGAPW